MKEKLKKIFRPLYSRFRFLYSKPIGFYRYYKQQQLNLIQKQFADKLSFFRTETKTKSNSGILLVQMVEDYEYTLKLAAASKVLAEKKNLKVNFCNVLIDWITKKEEKSIYRKASIKKLHKIYTSFGQKVIFDNDEKYKDQLFIQEKLNKIVSKLDINDGSGILTIQFDGIFVGDLIYDTYLRFFNKHTIEKIDGEVIHIIEVTLNVFYNFKAFIKSNDIKHLLTTYSSYIHHGIPVRVCLNSNIEVTALASHVYVFQELNKDFSYHQINHTLFSPNKKLSEEQLNLAKDKFTFRFTGKNDAATSYMRQNAFSKTPISEELRSKFAEGKRNLVIYPHEFYDSPHINRMLQFPDLYQYLKQTLAALTDIKQTNVYIKIHPNSMPGTKEKTIELVNSFGVAHFHVLDEAVSNHHIIELKPDLIATARGTVCVEMAYFEIPTVALYDNLYTGFDFVQTCTDTKSYFAILRGEEKPLINFDKKNIYSFYYQAFLEQTVKEENNIFNVLHSYKGSTFDDEYLKFILSNQGKIFSSNFLEYYKNIVT